jgi:predicted methyltransferase
MNTQKLAVVTVLAASCALGALAEPLPANIEAAAKEPARAEQAKVDAVRHGPEILAFAGVQSGAKVVDLIPGGGYWTGLLSGAVGSGGHVYAVWPAEYVKVDGDEVKPYRELAAKYANVSILEQPAAGFTAPEKVDLVFTAQNYHDIRTSSWARPTPPCSTRRSLRR